MHRDHRRSPYAKPRVVGRRVSFDIPLALFLSFSDLSLAGAPDLSVLSLLSPFDSCPCRVGARGVRYKLQNWFLTSPIVYRSDEAPRPIAPQTADARRIVVCLCAFLAFTPTLLRSRYITVYAPPLVGSAVVRICHILIPVSLCSVSTGRAKENEAKILHTRIWRRGTVTRPERRLRGRDNRWYDGSTWPDSPKHAAFGECRIPTPCELSALQVQLRVRWRTFVDKLGRVGLRPSVLSLGTRVGIAVVGSI